MKAISIVLFLCSAFLPATGSCEEPPPKAPEHREPQLQVWDGFWNARINWRYHVMEGQRWGWWDRASRIGVVVLALVSLCGPYVYEKRKLWKAAWYVTGALSLLLTVSVFIWPFPEWTGEDTVFAGRWKQLANDWYALYEKAPSLSSDVLEDRIASLKKTEADIESDEKTNRYDESAMIAAEKAERQYQGFNDESAFRHHGTTRIR